MVSRNHDEEAATVAPAVSYDQDFFEWTQQTAELIEQRREITLAVDDSPRRIVREDISLLYEDAVRSAMSETEVGRSAFPERCPFGAEEILDPDFFGD